MTWDFPTRNAETNVAEEEQGLKLNDQDSDSVLFRPMPTWVVRREQEAIARVPQRPGEEIAKNFRLNNPKIKDLENTHVHHESVKVWKEGPPQLEESTREGNQASVIGAANIARSPRSQTGQSKPMYQPTKVSYARNPARPMPGKRLKEYPYKRGRRKFLKATSPKQSRKNTKSANVRRDCNI